MLSSASLSGRAETNEKDTRMKNTDTRQAGGSSGTSKPQKNLHFINPFTDVGFKRIFGQEVNKDLLMDFLNELLAGEERIEEIRFMDKEQLPDNEQDRGIIYDIFCRTEDGRHLIIEMQNDSQTYFRNRSLFYACRGIVRQGRRGRDWRYALDAVYCINFCNFASMGKLRSDFLLMDWETKEVFTDRIRLIYIEFPFFTKTEQECGTELEQWIYILKNMETLEKMPFKNEKDRGGPGAVRGESEGLPGLLRLLGVPGGKGPAGRILGRSSGRGERRTGEDSAGHEKQRILCRGDCRHHRSVHRRSTKLIAVFRI